MSSDFQPGAESPDIEDVELLAALFDEEPVVILLLRWRAVQIAHDGHLFAADALTAAVQSHGARAVGELNFDAAPQARDWQVVFDLAKSSMQIVMPDGNVLYDSGLQCTTQWRQQVIRRQPRGLVVIIGSAAPTPDAAMEMIARGQASWVRASVELA